MFFVGGVGCEEVASKNMNIADPEEGVDVDCVKASYWEGRQLKWCNQCKTLNQAGCSNVHYFSERYQDIEPLEIL